MNFNFEFELVDKRTEFSYYFFNTNAEDPCEAFTFYAKQSWEEYVEECNLIPEFITVIGFVIGLEISNDDDSLVRTLVSLRVDDGDDIIDLDYIAIEYEWDEEQLKDLITHSDNY